MAKKKQKAEPATAPAIPRDRPPTIPPPAAQAARAKLAKQEYKVAPTSSLKLHPRNAKKGDVEAIGESIDKNDFYGAIIVQKSTRYILAGNHRWKSAVEKGLPDVPVIEVDVDDDTAERILTADNRIADLGTYDEALMMANLEAQKARTGSLDGTGFRDADLDRMKAKLSAPSEFPAFDGSVTVTHECPKCGFKWS